MADRDILPLDFKPKHYDLTIKDLSFGDWSYKGTVAITGELVNPSREIVLNALDLKILDAKVEVASGKTTQTLEALQITDDTEKQRATIAFPDELSASAKATLRIGFAGIVNHDLAGFYRSQYKPPVAAAASVPSDGEFHYMLSTQFEACDARRAFPCFDEPNRKATFDFAIEIPDDQVALSNMPVRETTTAAGRPGWKLVAFETTPVMSTYLLAWAVGDFEYVEAFTERRYGGGDEGDGKPLPVRVYTTRGLAEQGRWALQHAPKIIDYFSEQFEIDYPLPKSDILAVHEFTHGAMENWGLVTYRVLAILFDEEHSDARFRNRIAYVVAHELAHQWFGNLVTMDWWDELWLNEGFATWAGWLATDYLHPEWEVWPQLVNEGMAQAFSLDAVRASHPIQVAVRDALDVNQIFDRISYIKGCSVIRMLAAHLGIKTFLRGVAIYLKGNTYRNAKTEALWSALTEASGTDVNALMGPWIEKTGFPVVTVAEEPGQITVRQSRFLSTGDARPEDDETVWWVPLGLQGTKENSQGLALTTKETTIRGVDESSYLVNSNATGFYRVNYPPPRLQALGTPEQLSRLSVEDKIFIAGSAADLAFSGHGTTAALLAFLQGFRTETHLRVLGQALDCVGQVKSVFGDDDAIRSGLEAFTLRLIDSALAQVGRTPVAGEDINTTLLRKRLLVVAVANGHEDVIKDFSARFAAYQADPEAAPIQADLRTPVYRAAVRTDPAGAVAALKKEWYATSTIDGKEICLSAIGKATGAELLKTAVLPLLTNVSPPAAASEAVPAGDVHYLAVSLAGNREARPLLWAYVRDGGGWARLSAKLGGNPILLDRLVSVGLGGFSDRQTLAGIETFFAGISTAGFDRTLETVKDKIRGRAAYRERDAAGLTEWLQANGYGK